MADAEMDPIMALSHLAGLRALPDKFFQHTAEDDPIDTVVEFSSVQTCSQIYLKEHKDVI